MPDNIIDFPIANQRKFYADQLYLIAQDIPELKGLFYSTCLLELRKDQLKELYEAAKEIHERRE